MKILDSDHCIAILRGQTNIDQHLAPEETLAVTSISVAELIHGVYKSNRPTENLTRLAVFLSKVQIFPFDEESARLFGWLKAQLQLQGMPIADMDLQIASIAIVQRVPLLTHNRAHFQRLVAQTNLQLEDWLT